MVRYIAGRLLQAVVTLLGVVTIIFFLVRLSGDPARLLAPQNATASDIARIRHQLGLDTSLWSQYFHFLGQAIHGNFGFSYVQDQPAMQIVLNRFPNTVELAVGALVVALGIGVPVGIISAVYRGRWPERVLMPLILVGQSMPAFWSGILLILIFSVKFHLFPSSGQGGIRALILPAVTLGSLSLATVARMARGSFLEQLDREYVRTARAKGSSAIRVMFVHVFRNALLPVLTITGLEAANLLGGAVLTEVIFAWPGIGQLTIQSVDGRDFPVVQAVVLLAAIVYVVVNLVVDLLYGVVDPRLRLAGAST